MLVGVRSCASSRPRFSGFAPDVVCIAFVDMHLIDGVEELLEIYP